MKDAPAFDTRCFRPKLLRLGRAGHSLIDLCLSVDADCGEQLPCRRVDRVEACGGTRGQGVLQVTRDEFKDQVTRQTILQF